MSYASWLVVLSTGIAGCGRVGFDARASESGDALAPMSDANGDAASAVLAGCVVRLAMDEASWASGSVQDSCGTHQGMAVGGAAVATDAVRGTVGSFVGGTSCVLIPDAPDLRATTAVTISAWVKPAALAPNSFGIVSKRIDFGVSTEYSLFVWTDNNGAGSMNQVYADIDTENDRVANPNVEFLDAWHQVTLVFDGTLPQAQRVMFYVDGTLSFTAPESSSAIAAVTGTQPDLAIGCLPLSGPAQSLVGNLDDVVVWTRALSAQDVSTWYAATLH